MKKSAACVPATGLATSSVTVGSLLVITLLMTSLNADASSLILNFAGNTGSSVQFNGASQSFNFNSGNNGYQWNVSNESGGSSAVGLNGSVNGGPFYYGPITTTGAGFSMIQSATVLGPLGNLVIYDGTGNLTGTVNWIDIATYYVSIGALNASVNVNVTGISYSGSNPDLQSLMANQPATLDVSFQFLPGETLTQLSTGSGPYTTSFSGSVSVASVPEPTTLALAGLGGLSLLMFRRQYKVSFLQPNIS